MTAPFAYDAVEYPTLPIKACHPSRLCAVGRLFGLTPSPPDTCRLLDVGCGTGIHLLAAAVELPGAQFVGLDLSADAIRRGKELAAAAGIKNVELRHADILQYNPDPGGFDYVTAHGFYSWVPSAARDRFLNVARAALAPRGLGYCSYNTLPGGHLRRMVWEMMKFHTRAANDPAEAVTEGKALVEFLLAGQPKADSVPAHVLRAEAERLRGVGHPGMIYHDDFSPVNDPVSVTEFAAHLGQHGLRFVAESDVHMMNEGAFPPPTAEILRQMRSEDVVWKEQYIDFLKLRKFRQTVFARAEAAPASAPQAWAVEGLSVGLTQRLTPGEPDATGKIHFAAAGGGVTVGHPKALAVFNLLCERFPAWVPFSELAAATGANGTADRTALMEVLLAGYLGGPVDFFTHSVPFTTVVGERPRVSPLARAQAARGGALCTLRHDALDLGDGPAREVLARCDGTRTRAELGADELIEKAAGAGLLLAEARP